MRSSIWDERREALRAELKAMRISEGLTQLQVADRLSVPQSFVSKYESGERRLDFVEVIDVCAACNASWTQLASVIVAKV